MYSFYLFIYLFVWVYHFQQIYYIFVLFLKRFLINEKLALLH